jgi:FPC/CPF motif-containing protein YcgG
MFVSEFVDQPPSWVKPVRSWNPLHDDLRASRLSSYLGVTDGKLSAVLDARRACTEEEVALHEHLGDTILAPGFPCVAARSVMNRKNYRMGLYPALGSIDAAAGVCNDLYEFAHEMRTANGAFTSFIAAFRLPHIHNEMDFENLLWQQLQRMHEVDARYFPWDASVSRDPAHPNFSFSIGGCAFFVVGLNPSASRRARRTRLPCVVFNPHAQFETLRAQGKFEQLQHAIRQRDMDFQGSINPVLTDFGEQSESRQYSGRSVPAQWRCPFAPHDN